MHGKTITLTVILMVISFAVVPTSVTARDSHENFDLADTDISALLYMLNQTQLFMTSSLEHSLLVDYHHDLGGEPLSYNYSEEDVSRSITYAYDSKDLVAAASSILDDIEDVSSSEYLEQLYVPHHQISEDLIRYSESHGGLLLNLSSTINIYNSVYSNETDEIYIYEGLDSLQKASINLHRMDDHLSHIRDGIGELDGAIFNISALESVIEDNFAMLSRYQVLIDELLLLFDDIPSHLSFYTPYSAHPGETIMVYGHYIEDGEYVSDEIIEVKMDNTYIFRGETDQGGYYEIYIPIPWNATDTIRFNASTLENDIYREAVVEILRYPTNIVLELSRYYFYDEDIEVTGRFETEAPVDLSILNLSAPFDMNLLPNEHGEFNVTYHRGDFDWGVNSIIVTYGGNISMQPCEGITKFEMSVPTNVTLDCDRYGFFEDRTMPITFSGVLLNNSSSEGIPEQYVSIQGIPDMGSFTDEYGNYSLTTTINEMGVTEGLYIINSRFNGTQKYRECVSNILMIYIYVADNGSYVIDYSIEDILPWMDDEHTDEPQEPKDDEILGISREHFFLFIGLLLVVLLLALLYINKREDKEEISVRKKTKTVRSKKILRKYKLPSAKSREDIPILYGRTLEVLDSKGLIHITKGKTPRDILREMSQRDVIHKYFGELTSVFEKAFFSAHDLTGSEITTFNRALKGISKEVRGW